MKCNDLFMNAKNVRLPIRALTIKLWVGLIQPIEGVHLDTIYPHLPMKVRAGDPARPTHQADHLTLFHQIADLHKDLRLMPETTVHSPAMVNDRCVPTHG